MKELPVAQIPVSFREAKLCPFCMKELTGNFSHVDYCEPKLNNTILQYQVGDVEYTIATDTEGDLWKIKRYYDTSYGEQELTWDIDPTSVEEISQGLQGEINYWTEKLNILEAK